MRETQALIERVRRVGTQWQHLDLAVEQDLAQIQPGQTVLARLNRGREPYLREQWIPLGYNPDEGVLVVERPLVEFHEPGDEVSLIGPVGVSYEVNPVTSRLLLVALDYPPTRLLALMLKAIADGLSVMLVLTGSARDYPLSELPAAVEVIHSDNPNTWPDQERTISWADQVFAVTSPTYAELNYNQLWQDALRIRRALPQAFLHGIYTLPLPCGTGACLACLVRRKGADHLACIQGPAFNLAEMNFA
jgi:hypothetical protein